MTTHDHDSAAAYSSCDFDSTSQLEDYDYDLGGMNDSAEIADDFGNCSSDLESAHDCQAEQCHVGSTSVCTT